MHCVRRGNTCKYIPLHERDKEARQASRGRKKRGSDLDGSQGKKPKTAHPAAASAELYRSASAEEDTEMANDDADAEEDDINGEAAHIDASL